MFDWDVGQTRVVGEGALPLTGSVVTIGAFDGVHQGHQALIRAAVAEGWALGLPSVVWTFDPPPKVFFGRAAALSPLAEKLARIARLGPDYIVVAAFDAHYAARPAERFLNDLARLSPRRVHVGADFRFGAGQSGDVALLAQRFTVATARSVRCPGGEVISSTRIRGLRASGHDIDADALLGLASPRLASAWPPYTDLRSGENHHG